MSLIAGKEKETLLSLHMGRGQRPVKTLAGPKLHSGEWAAGFAMVGRPCTYAEQREPIVRFTFLSVLYMPGLYKLSLKWIGFGVNHPCVLKVDVMVTVLGMLCDCSVLLVKVPNIVPVLEKSQQKIFRFADTVGGTVGTRDFVDEIGCSFPWHVVFRLRHEASDD